MQKPLLAKYYGEPFDLVNLGNGRAIAKLREKRRRPLFTARKLESQDFHKVYVCSPLSAPTPEGIEANMLRARQYMVEVSGLYGGRAVAPHAYLPCLLDDSNPAERAMAMAFGKKLLFFCDALVICGDTITRGMASEIAYAIELGKPIIIGRYWAVENWSVTL